MEGPENIGGRVGIAEVDAENVMPPAAALDRRQDTVEVVEARLVAVDELRVVDYPAVLRVV